MKRTNGKRNGRLNHSVGGGGKAGGASGGGAAAGPVDRFMALSDEEKEAVFRDLDRPIPGSEARPMTPGERAEWDRARRKPGRPKIGKGAEIVSVTVEKGLLERVDAYAKEKGLSRARMVGIALESFLEDVRRYRAAAAAARRSPATGKQRA